MLSAEFTISWKKDKGGGIESELDTLYAYFWVALLENWNEKHKSKMKNKNYDLVADEGFVLFKK